MLMMNGCTIERLSIPPISFQKHILENGLEVIIRRQDDLPQVAVNLWYHVGSKNEERNQRGFAHLFEHLMFEGSEHYPSDFFQPLERLGASINGSTSSDRTNYFIDLPAAHLELALAMESDRMANLLPALTDAKLSVQKDVVHNEYRQNYANRPYGQVWRILAESLYPREHPYSWLTIGEMQDVLSATRTDVAAFFQRYYVPSNASLAVVGDIQEDQALGWIESYFGSIPGGARAVPRRVADPGLEHSIELVLHEPVALDRLYLVWHSARLFHPDEPALGILADILGRGRASRLYRRLVVQRELAQDVHVAQTSRELAGCFGITVTLRPGKSWSEALGEIEDELADLAMRGPEAAELQRAQTGRLASVIYSLDRAGGFGGVADRLNAFNIYTGDPGRITSDIARFQAVELPHVQGVASRYLFDMPRVRLVVLGRMPKAPQAPLNRSQAPVSAAPARFVPPMPQEHLFACGARAWIIPRRGLPVVAASAAIRAGASAHPACSGGLAQLTAALLDEGTHTRSASQLAEEVEDLGSTLTASCGWDGSYVSFHAITPNWVPTLDLAIDVLQNPAFPAAEFHRIKAQSLAAHAAQRDRGDILAHRLFLATAYAADHPYAVPIDGSLRTIQGIEREALAAYHAAMYRPDQTTWIIAGDVEIAATIDLLAQKLEGWRPQASRFVPPPLEVTSALPAIILIDRPNSAQANLRIGTVGIPRSHADHDALIVWNHILGGKFTSRLNEKLREERGFTYGIRSHFEPRRGAGPFSITAAVDSAHVGDALRDIRREFEAMADSRPATPTELEDARRALLEGQAHAFETPEALVSRYASLFVLGLPLDEYATLPDRLARLSPDMLTDAARRWMNAAHLITVVAADAEAVGPQLEDLGWGPVVIKSVDQVI
jgi:predicted Zn-dependent peptidase